MKTAASWKKFTPSFCERNKPRFGRCVRAWTRRNVHAAAHGVITDAGYGDAFNHGLGHGIGLQIHEGPTVRANSTDVLAEGMVFTIEPGIYLPGWGGVRIEDDVRVTADGCEVLTSTPRDLWLLGASR